MQFPPAMSLNYVIAASTSALRPRGLLEKSSVASLFGLAHQFFFLGDGACAAVMTHAMSFEAHTSASKVTARSLSRSAGAQK